MRTDVNPVTRLGKNPPRPLVPCGAKWHISRVKITRAQLPVDPISALKVLAFGTLPSKRPRRPADIAKRLKPRKQAVKPRR